MTLLVVGASGYVGRHVSRYAVALGVTVVGTFHANPLHIEGVQWRQLDITDRAAVVALMNSVQPQAVVSTAYAPAPSLAPVSASINWPTNALGPVYVATAAAALGARLVHVSSDAVHSGRPERITEADAPNPTYPYGAAKAAAEVGVAVAHPSSALTRVSLINSDGVGELSSRERFMIDLAERRTSGVLFSDDVRCPVAVTDVAAALVELALGESGGGTAAAGSFAGVLNIAGPDAVSFYELGVLVARRHRLDPAALASSACAGLGRPGNVVLDAALAASLLQTRLRGIREILA
jgi:dTDP-4-dehydrorhamnose reductase